MPCFEADSIILYFSGPEHAANSLPKDEVDILNITKEHLHDLLRRGREYWGDNLMGARLYWIDRKIFETARIYRQVTPELNIHYHKDFGFILFHMTHPNTPAEVVVTKYAVKEMTDEVVRVELDAQSPVYFPSSAFFEAGTSERIVDHFVESLGDDFYSGVKWIESSLDFFDEDNWELLDSDGDEK